MGKLRTALTFAMRAGKPLRKASDIVKLGRQFRTPVGRQMMGATDDVISNLPVRSSGGLVRSGGGGMVPTGGSSMVSGRGGASMGQPGGAMVRQGSGAMTPYNPGGPLTKTSPFIPPVGLVPMFTNPPLTPPTVGPNDWDTVPDPSMVPRDPITPQMTPGFTPTPANLSPAPMMPRTPVPMSMPPMPDMPMTVPPAMELPDVMPLAPRIPTMPDMNMGPLDITTPDMSMGRPDITMPGFETVFDDPDPTPGPMDLGVPEIDYGFLDSITPLPAPVQSPYPHFFDTPKIPTVRPPIGH